MNMNVTHLSLPEVLLIAPQIHPDHRGHLAVPFSVSAYEQAGISFSLRQINQGYSKKAFTIRGLHYQQPPYHQAKLVSANHGSFFSVAVDIRKDSPTFGQWCGAVLSFENQRLMYVPRGFAHGYLTLEPDTVLQYCVDNDFCGPAAKALRFDDPDIGIVWPAKPDETTLTEKDRNATLLQDLS